MVDQRKNEDSIELQKRQKEDQLERTNNKHHSSDELNQSFVDPEIEFALKDDEESDQTCWEAFKTLITFRKREDKYSHAKGN